MDASVIEHFEKPVAERTPEEMCVHAKSVLDVMCAIPPAELNDGDIMVGQLAENVRQLLHAMPIEQLEQHRVVSPVDRREWMVSAAATRMESMGFDYDEALHDYEKERWHRVNWRKQIQAHLADAEETATNVVVALSADNNQERARALARLRRPGEGCTDTIDAAFSRIDRRLANAREIWEANRA